MRTITIGLDLAKSMSSVCELAVSGWRNGATCGTSPSDSRSPGWLRAPKWRWKPAAAQAMSARWIRLSLAEQRRWLLGVDVRIVVHAEPVTWSCCPGQLQAGKLEACYPTGTLPSVPIPDTPRYSHAIAVLALIDRHVGDRPRLDRASLRRWHTRR